MMMPAIAQETVQTQQPPPAQDNTAQPTSDDDTIVVSGFREALATAREIARQADNLVDVQSADDLGKLPDTNIAEALRRLDSVYLIRDQGEGRYVSIRGVDPILNNVTMNGQTIAVSDTDGESGRAAPLDVLSSGALSRVEIHKVTLPSMDGQSIGGTINIVTPSGFDYKDGYLNFGAEIGYNDFGTDSDIYAANLAWATTFGANDEFALYLSSEYWYKEYTSQQYTASGLWTNASLPAHYYLPGSIVYAQSIGEKERYGLNANLEWRPDDDTSAWLRYYFTQYNDYRDRPQITIATQGTRTANNLNQFGSQRYTANMETRSELQERPVHQLVIGGEREFGENWSLTGNLNYTTAKEVNPYQRYFQSTGVTSNAGAGQQPAITVTLNGRGLAGPTAFNTALSNGRTFMDPAFERITAFRGVTSDVIEETWTANSDLVWDGDFGGRQLELSTGFKVILRDKSVDDSDYRYFPLTGQTYPLSSFPDLTSPFSAGRGNPFAIVPGLNLIAPYRYGYEAYFEANPQNFYYDDATSRANSMENDYTLSENIYAAYVMGNYHITDALSVLAGVRVEQTDSDISAMGFVASATRDPLILQGQSRLPFNTSDIVDISRSKSYTNVLPAISMRWDIANDWLLRASVTTNIGRPDYTDMAPISTIVASETCVTPAPAGQGCSATELNGSVEIGNPDLEPYKGTNFDASLDYYFPDDSGVVTFGVFYKRIDNAIYSIFNEYQDHEFEGLTYATFFEETAANAEPGYIQGIEFSVQKDFTFLPAPFDGFGVYANAALIDSEVEINVGGDAAAPIYRKVPFFNQADEIYNVQLYYDKAGFSARIAYAFQGDATGSAFGTNPDMDNFRSPRETVDAQVSYTFDNGVRLSLTGSNLNNQPALNYRNGDEFFISSYELFGREIRLGVSTTW
jgi:TonB-dependent receptor